MELWTLTGVYCVERMVLWRSVHDTSVVYHVSQYVHVCTQLYSVPDFKLVFSVRNFSSAPTTLKDSGTIPQQQR